jgi:hypothetical protein
MLYDARGNVEMELPGWQLCPLCAGRVDAAAIIPTRASDMPLNSARTLSLLMIPAVLLLLLFDPASTWWFPSCPFRLLTGWLCPLCGSLRAMHALLVGDPVAAFALNPLTTAAVVVFVVALAYDLVVPRRAVVLRWLLERSFSVPALVLVIAFGVLRNMSEPLARLIR